MTEAEAAENDKAWERYHTYNRLRRDYGVTDADYDRERAELAAKWGCEPSPADVLWRWANGRSAQLGGQGDWQGLGVLTFTMALQLYEEGRDHFKLSQVARKYELLAMQREEKNQPYKIRVRVLGVCPESRALEGRLYTIEEALEEMPIPRADCTWQTSARGSKSGRGWCACTYTEELQF